MDEPFVKKVIEKLGLLVFPGESICMICNKPLGNTEKGICLKCISSIPRIASPYCSKCGKPLSKARVKLCNDCYSTPIRYFSYNRSYGEYNGILKQVIIDFKYKNKRSLTYPLGFLLFKLFEEQRWEKPDYIIPVPLSRKRLSHRGFNQASLLCEFLSSKTQIPVLSNILIRVNATEHQTKLGKYERQENVKDAFRVMENDMIKGNKILLIDDVYTTGSTLDECSKVLIDAGATKIYTLTLAVGTYIRR